MKFISTLFVILAIIGLGQTHKFPDFGRGSLHEDIQDLLDLVPAKEISEIVIKYISEDPEVQDAINYLLTSTVLPNLLRDMEAIPEVIILMNYMQKEGIDIYSLRNAIKKALDKLIPPSSYSYSTLRTSGLARLFNDIKKVIPFDKYIRTYVRKMKTSSAFVGFINQLKSNNFQQLVNKIYQVKSFQIIVNGLKSRGVNTQIVADIMYIVLGITVPNGVYQEDTLEEELMDFVELIPADESAEIILKYITEDDEVESAMLYLSEPEFQSNLRDVEALKEHQALVVYLQKSGLNVIKYIQWFHENSLIEMKDYVPPKIEIIFKSEIGMLKIGDGMKGMIKDLYNILPHNKIDFLYKRKLQNSKVFADFIEKIKSPELQELINNLYRNQIYKNFVLINREMGLEFQELMKHLSRIFGLKFLY